MSKYTIKEISKLRSGVDGLFILDGGPTDSDSDQTIGRTACASEHQSDSSTIIGRILPTRQPYCQASFVIKIDLPDDFPFSPPQVRIVTPIYHPNVDQSGFVCSPITTETGLWTPKTSLVDVIKSVVDIIDNPSLDYAVNPDSARLYREDRENHDKIALEYTQKYGRPRT